MIGAGFVVTKDVAPYSVVAWNPCNEKFGVDLSQTLRTLSRQDDGGGAMVEIGRLVRGSARLGVDPSADIEGWIESTGR